MGPYQQKIKEDKIWHVDKESVKKRTVKHNFFYINKWSSLN